MKERDEGIHSTDSPRNIVRSGRYLLGLQGIIRVFDGNIITTLVWDLRDEISGLCHFQNLKMLVTEQYR